MPAEYWDPSLQPERTVANTVPQRRLFPCHSQPGMRLLFCQPKFGSSWGKTTVLVQKLPSIFFRNITAYLYKFLWGVFLFLPPQETYATPVLGSVQGGTPDTFTSYLSLPFGFATDGMWIVFRCTAWTVCCHRRRGTQHPRLPPLSNCQPLKINMSGICCLLQTNEGLWALGAGGSFHLLCEFLYMLSLVRKKTPVSEQLCSYNILNSTTRVSETALHMKGNLVFCYI